jgi:thioredoxin 1
MVCRCSANGGFFHRHFIRIGEGGSPLLDFFVPLPEAGGLDFLAAWIMLAFMKTRLMPAMAFAALALAGCEKTREAVTSKVDELLESKEEAEAAPTSAPVNTVRLTDRTYEEFVAQRGVLVVVAFSADWCGPCRQLGPVLDKVAGEFPGRVRLGRVDIDHWKETANFAGVRGIPDVRLFRDGRDVTRFTGSRSEKDVRKIIRENLPEETTPPTPADAPPTGEPAPPAIRPMEKDWVPPGIRKTGT